MLRTYLYLVVLLSLPTVQSGAADYCHEANLVLDKEVLWNFTSGFASELTLPTHRAEALVPSMGKVLFGSSGEQLVYTFFENSGEGTLGIEYMVYKLEIRIGDALDTDSQLYSEDFSRDCSEPGLGIDYGGRHTMPPLRILPRANGEPRGIEKVRIRVWGWQ